MIRTVGGNVDAYTYFSQPARYASIERVSDIAVGQSPNVPICDADKAKYDAALADLNKRNIRHGRYINSQHAVVSNTSEKWPTNALPVALFDETIYYGGPTILRPGVIVRRYNLAPEVNRTRLADALCTEHAKFPDRDLYLDGVIVPELVDSSVPWRFSQVCDLLMKVRQRLATEQELGINLAGATADLTTRHMDMLINAGVKLITFERAGVVEHGWRVAQACGKLLLSGVLPVFDVRDDEQAGCKAVCATVGAAMAV